MRRWYQTAMLDQVILQDRVEINKTGKGDEWTGKENAVKDKNREMPWGHRPGQCEERILLDYSMQN